MGRRVESLLKFLLDWLGCHNMIFNIHLSFFLAFFLSILEVLVAALQAYIFTMLTALYFGSANEEHHHEEAH